MIRHFILFSLTTSLLSGCIDLLQQTKTKKEDDLQSVKHQVEELRAERAERNVIVDDLKVRIQLVDGEIDSTRYTANQKFDEFDERLKRVEDRLVKIEERLENLNLYSNNSKEAPAGELWEDAQAYFNSKKYTDAILKYEELKTKFPDYKDLSKVYLQQARSFSELKKNKEAKLFYNKVKELYPKSKEAKEAESEIRALK